MEWNYHKIKGWVVTAAILLGWPLLASAEGLGVGDSGFSLGPRATYFKAKDAAKGTWYAGAQARFHPTSVLGLEGSIDYRKNKYAGDVTIKGFPVQATLLVYLIPQSPVSPYLLGGAGWYFTQVESPGIAKKTDNRFGPHAGAGLEAKLGPSLSVDGSYRYIWLSDVKSSDKNAITQKYRDSGTMITVAANFLF
jgi:opacity protein-like surface antigen